ncbi:MAG: hypothetical protein J1F43_06380 [Muribaculaceae bacterium]|nr:hypothetical protein [Muribaculaceae bacterium]
MEDDQIRKLFEDYRPVLSSSSEFINETLHCLESYDIVKRSLDNRFRLSWWRSLASSLIGFLCGALLTFYFPYIREIIYTTYSYIFYSVPDLSNEVYNVLTWTFISLCIIFITIGSYTTSFTLSRFFARKS